MRVSPSSLVVIPGNGQLTRMTLFRAHKSDVDDQTVCQRILYCEFLPGEDDNECRILIEDQYSRPLAQVLYPQRVRPDGAILVTFGQQEGEQLQVTMARLLYSPDNTLPGFFLFGEVK
jgi:hypothetical protein